ncbi:MAG TPA: serine/threonine-protein kinase, partial [Thermoanaerobaculia bacterium]|nr:serine/threonine-protein kinase [Thermoanaerobaculia bacterium]
IVDPNDFPMVDLSADPLLKTLPRMTFQGQSVPALGGIPLLEKLGQGGMGAVYRGVRVMLRQEVAVKVLPMQLAAHQQGLTERFVREAQMASRIESPHLVRVSDVGEIEGLFYIIMEFVRGPSAARIIRNQKELGRTGLDEAAALDLCISASRGLAAAHTQGIIHRDIKPDNILIPQTRDSTLLLGNAKVADLGLARSEESDRALTASSIGMGTPGYMAPEQAMSARHAGKPSDVFGMGATLYALLAGHAPFTGDSAASIIIATVQQPHPPIRDTRPDISEATARLLDQCLWKDPANRFADAAALVEALQICRNALTDSDSERTALVALTNLQGRPEVGQPLPPPTPTPPAGGAGSDRTVRVATAPRARRPMPLAIAALVLLALAAVLYFSRARLFAPPVIGLASGPEEAEWIRWAAEEFAKTDAGKGGVIRVLPMAAAEAEKNLLNGDRSINAWISTTALTRSAFERDWKSKYNSDPIVRAEVLGVTPHVFVMVKSRHDQFAQKYGALNFKTLRAALTEPGGWKTIGEKPEWGRFTFAITRPAVYESGLATLALIAFDYHGKDEGLTSAEVSSPAFAEWAGGFMRGFRIDGNPAQIVDTIVLKGPSAYDGVVTYESLVMRELDDIEDRWGAAQLVYPAVNIWNETTYFVLDTPWNTPKARKVTEDFLQFLLSETA